MMNLKRNFVCFTTCAVVVAGMAAWVSDVQAFRMIQVTSTGRLTAGAAVPCNSVGGFVHWTNSSTINWYHNTAGQGSNKAAALHSALSSWTNVPNANHVPTYAGTTTAGWATDGLNTLLWSVGNGCTGNCLALTALVVQSGQVVIESDITFNANVTWTTNGTTYDTEAVAAHEVGHSLGIHHSEVTSPSLPTMHAAYFGSGGRSLETDDLAALQCAQNRYPLPPPPGTPSAPGSLRSGGLTFCNGGYSVLWNASSGTVNAYELYVSSNASFSPQSLKWTGTATGTSIIVGPAGTVRYFRVRACNVNGCSGYSNSLVLSGYNGCP